MELKNIFKMTKADRYTQDGRDEIAKLQETEDVKYKTGDISQKTGLQKQPDGSWAPPKKGGKLAAKKEASSINRPGWEETRMASGKIYDLKSQGKRIIEQYDPETETKTFKLRDLNNSRSPDKEFKSLEEAKAAAEQRDQVGAESKKTEYKLGDQLKLKNGKIVEFAGHTSNGKIRYTDKSGSTPITGAIEETEIDEVDNSSLSPREYAERMEESKPAAEKEPSIPTDKEVSNSLDELSNSKEMASKVIGGVKVTYNPENGFYKVTHKAPGGQEVSRGCSDILEAQQAVMFRLDRIKKGEIPAIEESTSAESKPAGSIPIQGPDWISLPSGTRMTHEGAREKMARNNERIETIKKMMEGRSRADNFRLGSELKSLQNENEWIESRLPPEKLTPTDSAPRILTGDTKIRVRK